MIESSARVLALVIGVAAASSASAIEQLPYTVVSQDEIFELRQYDTHVVAAVAIDGSSKQAGNSGFRTLFKYIDGNNATNSSISMTAPVLQSREGPHWRVAFVMPAASNVDSLPAPAAGAVELREVPSTLMAAITYSGNWSRARYDEHERKLRGAISQSALRACGEPIWARYDPPFMPTFLRRNEVLLPICRATAEH